LKPYILIAIVVWAYWLLISFIPPEVRQVIKMLLPIYLIWVVLSGLRGVFKNLKKVADTEEIEPQSLDQIQERVKEYRNKEIDSFTYKLSREIKGMVEKNKYKNCRHMWE